MRIVRYRGADGVEAAGVVEGMHILRAAVPFVDLLTSPSTAVLTRARVPLSEVTLLPPIAEQAKVFCVGYNYPAHGAEMARETPDRPTLFVRYVDSLVGSGTPIVRPPESRELDWEGEVGIVIGRGGRRIATSEAAQHVAGFTAVADNSVRDWQFHSAQATAGKNWPASGACGPWVQTLGAAGLTAWSFETRLNGVVVQSGDTADLVFSVAELVSYTSTFTELRAGDLIATGTPAGIGYRMEPPRYLRDGDLLEISIEGFGALACPVVDEGAA